MTQVKDTSLLKGSINIGPAGIPTGGEKPYFCSLKHHEQ
jgi:hypothetical protein